ncbi:hypothetical protein CR513_10200, partial [Mucuna pruriens]
MVNLTYHYDFKRTIYIILISEIQRRKKHAFAPPNTRPSSLMALKICLSYSQMFVNTQILEDGFWLASIIVCTHVKGILQEQGIDYNDGFAPGSRVDTIRMGYEKGMIVLQCSYEIYICQRKYALEIMRQFGIEECNPICNPIVSGYKLCRDERRVKANDTQFKQMVGGLMYITTR